MSSGIEKVINLLPKRRQVELARIIDASPETVRLMLARGYTTNRAYLRRILEAPQLRGRVNLYELMALPEPKSEKRD